MSDQPPQLAESPADTKKPPTRCAPVFLFPDGPVSTVQQLQELGGLDRLPEGEEMTCTDGWGSELGARTICMLTINELEQVKERARVQMGPMNPVVTLRGKIHVHTILVTGPKAEEGPDENLEADYQKDYVTAMAWTNYFDRGHDSDGEDPWFPGVWDKACDDIRAGTFKSGEEKLFPIVLEPDGPLSTPEQLQQLAELETVPEVIETARLDWNGAGVGSATVCAVSRRDRRRMEEKVDIGLGFTLDFFVSFEGESRAVLLVLGPKAAVAAGPDELGE